MSKTLILPNNPKFYERDGKIHVSLTIGSKRYRKSTGITFSQTNLKKVQKNASEVLSQIIEKINKPKNKVIEHEDFATFAREVVTAGHHRRNKNTQQDVESKLENMILPSFTGFKVPDITTQHVDRLLYHLLTNQGYSTSTVKKARNLISLIMDKAVASRLIDRNPVQYAEKIAIVKKKRKPYTPDEMRRILSATQDDWIRAYLFVAFTTGLRSGEILALKWKDIDFKNGIIYLCRSISKGIITDFSEIEKSDNKKNHERLIIMPRVTIIVLDTLRKQSTCEWIFPNPKTQQPYWGTNSVRKNKLMPLLKRAGVPYRTLYATRHTYVSYMRNSGVGKDLVAEIAGHSVEVDDAYYFTPVVEPHKVEAVNNAFKDLKNLKNCIE